MLIDSFPFSRARKKGTLPRFKQVVRDDPLWEFEIQALLKVTSSSITSLSSKVVPTPTLQPSGIYDYYIQEMSRPIPRRSVGTTASYASVYGQPRLPNFMNILED